MLSTRRSSSSSSESVSRLRLPKAATKAGREPPKASSTNCSLCAAWNTSRDTRDETCPPSFWKSPRSHRRLRMVYVVDFFQPSSCSASFASRLEGRGSFSHMSSAKRASTAPSLYTAM